MPDIEAYLEALRPRVVGATLLGVRLGSVFVLRTVVPALTAVAGSRVDEVSRLGKRIVLALGPTAEAAAGLPTPWYLVMHLMIAGRLHWKPAGAALPKGRGLAALDFSAGTLLLTEAGTKRRASLHLVAGGDALRALDRGGLEPLSASPAELGARLRQDNHTLKRALTDPGLVSGIGNAYSDEILHRAGLSPFKMTQALDDLEVEQLHAAVGAVLNEWIERLGAEARERFPEHVTAFRPEMAVHGRFGKPCPVCGATVQRIVYADNECDYCPGCQTGGRILADRSLSRLLKDDWPLRETRPESEG